MSIHSITGMRAGELRALDPTFSPKRRDGGPYGWLTPYLAEMAAASPAFASRILSLPHDELHFIAMTLALCPDPEGVDLAAFARAIGREQRSHIFSGFAPGQDTRIVRLAGKLSGKHWRAPTYRRLAELYAEPKAKKALQHMPVISRRTVLTLRRLPTAYRTRGMLRMIKRQRDLSGVIYAIEVVRRIRMDLTDRQILASLEKTNSSFIRNWIEAHFERVPFPAAPTGTLFDGCGGILRAASSGSELFRWAREFDNCARNRLFRAANGQSAIYRYDSGGERIAFIELRRIGPAGWALNELEGPCNNDLPVALRLKIASLFEKEGVLTTPQAVYDRQWVELE